MKVREAAATNLPLVLFLISSAPLFRIKSTCSINTQSCKSGVKLILTDKALLLLLSRGGVFQLWDLMPEDLRWS